MDMKLQEVLFLVQDAIEQSQEALRVEGPFGQYRERELGFLNAMQQVEEHIEKQHEKQ